MIELGLALLVGVGLGVVTGLPLGVVNVAVIASAGRDGARAGTAIGLGGALADTTHAAIAFAGLAPVIAAHPTAQDLLAVASGLLLLTFAAYVGRPRSAAARTDDVDDAARPRSFVRRIATGLVLTLPNPAALAAWLAVATALGPRSTAASVAMAAGVGLGSAAYFAALARIAARSARNLRRPRWLDRGAALVIGAMGVVALARGLWL